MGQHQNLNMAWVTHEVDTFAICMLKRRPDCAEEGISFLDGLSESVRACGGNVQLRSNRPDTWEIVDGKNHFREPNHLNPAIFDFDAIVLAGFHSTEDLHTWWNSDQVFNLLKKRHPIEKMGIFVVDGLRTSFDVRERNKLGAGDKLVLFEFAKMLAFQPMQLYVDNYKRVAERAGVILWCLDERISCRGCMCFNLAHEVRRPRMVRL